MTTATSTTTSSANPLPIPTPPQSQTVIMSENTVNVNGGANTKPHHAGGGGGKKHRYVPPQHQQPIYSYNGHGYTSPQIGAGGQNGSGGQGYSNQRAGGAGAGGIGGGTSGGGYNMQHHPSQSPPPQIQQMIHAAAAAHHSNNQHPHHQQSQQSHTHTHNHHNHHQQPHSHNQQPSSPYDPRALYHATLYQSQQAAQAQSPTGQLSLQAAAAAAAAAAGGAGSMSTPQMLQSPPLGQISPNGLSAIPSGMISPSNGLAGTGGVAGTAGGAGVNGQAGGQNGAAGGAGQYGMMGVGMGIGGLNLAGLQGLTGVGSPYYSGGRAPAVINPLPPGGMDPAQMTGNYGPAAAAAAAAAVGNTTGRTVYCGNLPADASVDELMNLVRFGPVEAVRLLPEKSCVFISFLDGATAAAFHADATVKKLTLHGQELKIGWGKPSVVPYQIAQAIAQNKATRNVYLGGLPEELSESALRDDLSRFGPIDQVKIVRDKGIGFVHFLSILVAMKVVATLPTEEGWTERRVGYGKDRCAYVPRAQQAAVAAAQQQAALALGHTLGLPGSPFQGYQPPTPGSLYGFGSPTFSPNNFQNGAYPMLGEGMGGESGGRCVYLGSLDPEVTVEDLCNALRGGMLLQLRYMKDKHIAFATFAADAAANAFYAAANSQGLLINNKKVKIGWGKNPGPLGASTITLINAGATRNIYIGGIEDFETFTEAKLRSDFSDYGEIEQVNFLQEKKAAFVNFTALVNAVKAIEGIATAKPEYQKLKVSYGKDRCANPPKQGHFGMTPKVPRAPGAVSPSPISPNPVSPEVPTQAGESSEPTKEESVKVEAKEEEVVPAAAAAEEKEVESK